MPKMMFHLTTSDMQNSQEWTAQIIKDNHHTDRQLSNDDTDDLVKYIQENMDELMEIMTARISLTNSEISNARIGEVDRH